MYTEKKIFDCIEVKKIFIIFMLYIIQISQFNKYFFIMKISSQFNLLLNPRSLQLQYQPLTAFCTFSGKLLNLVYLHVLSSVFRLYV